MTTLYVNNASAGTYVDESGTSHTWGQGSDDNAGTSRAAPLLTANKAFGEYTWNNKNTFVFNEGTYTYTNNSGEWSVIGQMSLSGSEDYKTRIIFDGSATNGLKLAASVTGQTYNIGKVELARANASGGSSNIIRHLTTISAEAAVNIACRLILTEDIKYGIHGNAASGATTFNEGFGIASDAPITNTLTTIINLPNMRNTTLTVNSCDIDGFNGNFGTALFRLKYFAHDQGGGVSIKGIKGTATIAGVGSSTHIVSLEHAPDGATIEINEPLHIIYPDSTLMMGFGIFSKTELGKSANNARIFGSGSGSFTTTAKAGVLIRIGNIDNKPHSCDNGIIENVVTGGVDDPSNILHGICHFNTTSGIRRYNKVSGVLMPSLTKLGVAESYNNEYRTNVSSNMLTRVLYAKGAGAGTSFHDEKIYIDNTFGGVVECATRDDGGTLSTNVLYTNNKIIDDGGSFTSSAIFTQAGFPSGGTDNSSLFSSGLSITNTLTLPSNVAEINRVFYSSLNDANTTSSITDMNLVNPPTNEDANMGIIRYACDGIDGNDANTGRASSEGDFSNAMQDLWLTLQKANTEQADNGNTVVIEISGGASGVTYAPSRNLVFTSSDSTNNYTSGTGFKTNGSYLGDYGFVASKAAGHDGQVTIDAENMVFGTYGVVASNRKGTLIEGLKIINPPTSRDAITLSTAHDSAVRNCILEQGSHGFWANRSNNLEITGNFITGGSGSNSSAIKLEQDQSGKPNTDCLIASNYIWRGGSGTGTAGHFAIQLRGASGNRIYNNTVVDTVTDGIGLLANGHGEGALNNTIYNNIVVNSKNNGNQNGAVGHDIAIDTESAAGNTNTIDYNTYTTNRFYLGGSFGPSAADAWQGGTAYTSLSDWQAATGQDANSITTVPTFLGGAGPNSVDGIQITSGPQLQGGIATSLSTDIKGKVFRNPPNMGASALTYGVSDPEDPPVDPENPSEDFEGNLGPINWNVPTLTSLYETVLSKLKERDIANATQTYTGDSAMMQGFIQFDRTNHKWQEWSGTAWGDLATEYSITVETASNASKLNSKNASYYLDYSNMSGIITSTDVPSFSASKITSDTFDSARIPTLAKTKISETGTFAAADLDIAGIVGHADFESAVNDLINARFTSGINSLDIDTDA